MKYLVALCVVLSVAFVKARPDTTYTNKFDGIDLDDILSNRRLLVPYVKCALEQGKCSPEGKELRSHIKEALENYCGKCTDVQKRGTRVVIAHLINNETEFWNQLVDKYDPTRKYFKKYENEFKTLKA